ncbi:YgdI/YgdR family lipoprotein [Leisingera thetidis]|uniref:YgdI/YgdR family lipoprotein n=1 Tax=Leisingera thetidis TaxID=2930199 RepID=UPI0021F75263|nr:YgdI/YgdR family lipoprotein [Leisingera thetidis]
MKSLLVSLMMLAAATLAGCSSGPTATKNDVEELARALQSLDPEVDPTEARRAAEIAYSYSAQLAQQYNVTTSPILHNTLVNSGVKERGVCVHYAEDMQARLNQENFQTLSMLRAIAEPKSDFRIDHSTAVIAAKGDGIYDGIVLDPWRYGGKLYWSATTKDPRYDWEPRLEVLRRKYERRMAKEAAE